MLRRSRGTPTERRDDRAAIRGVRTPATATPFSARYLPRWLTLIRKSDQRSCAAAPSQATRSTEESHPPAARTIEVAGRDRHEAATTS